MSIGDLFGVLNSDKSEDNAKVIGAVMRRKEGKDTKANNGSIREESVYSG